MAGVIIGSGLLVLTLVILGVLVIVDRRRQDNDDGNDDLDRLYGAPW